MAIRMIQNILKTHSLPKITTKNWTKFMGQLTEEFEK